MGIKELPFWTYTNFQPAFYDSESGTALQQEAKVYAKMQELIKDYNAFINEINKHIKDFESGLITDYEEFRNCIIKTMNQYIETIDTKINIQDTKIEDAIDYMKTNLVPELTSLFNEAIANGQIRATFEYNPITESLTLELGGSE